MKGNFYTFGLKYERVFLYVNFTKIGNKLGLFFAPAYLVEPSGLEFILNDEPVNPHAKPALARLEVVAEGTFQLL